MDLADQPYAHLLEPHPGPLRADQRYDTVRFDDLELDAPQADGASFLECALVGLTINQGRLRRAMFTECWVERNRWVATDLAETEWQDCTVAGSLLAGVAVHGAQLRRLTLRQCKLEAVNLRAAVLRDVVFEDCQLRDVDFAEARLTGVSFPGSSLEEVRFGRAKLSGTDLRGATRLELPDGHEGLRGALISSGQLIELAPQFAKALGVEVRDA
ncbi:pentapeptide repeat-containing protein [Kitasatospora sp. NPDC006697]|uniref:pentapeptide repeat-containing protein n=1 Tax=Kitasatospora sp. NPDC006697 TaxID=3364020 RepID=UPI003699372C